MQAAITMSVIDGSLRFPHGPDMLTHEAILKEMIRQLDEGLVKPGDVARKLSIPAARVSEMRKHKRRIQQKEMPILAQFLGLVQELGGQTGVEESIKIPYLGKVAQGVWLEQSFEDTENQELEHVIYDRVRGDPPAKDLFAVTPEGTSMNKRFAQGTQLICRRVPFGIGSFVPGDYVIVERANHDLREMTCKRVEVDEHGVYWLHSESDDPRYQEPWEIGKPDADYFADTEIIIIAKVIRAVQDFERARRH